MTVPTPRTPRHELEFARSFWDSEAVADVFISYFRDDLERVKLVCAALEREKVGYWIDYEGLEAGQNWRSRIEERIQSASAFILCMSRKFQERPHSHVHVELEIAIERLSRLHPDALWYYPILIESCAPPLGRIAPGRSLGDYQLADGSSDLPAAAAHLAERVAAFVRDPAQNLARVTFRNLAKASGFLEIDGTEILDPGFRFTPDGYRFMPGMSYTTTLPPGTHRFRLKDDSINDHNGLRGQWTSNVLEVALKPREAAVVIIRSPRKSGFLWMTSESPNTWIVERI